MILGKLLNLLNLSFLIYEVGCQLLNKFVLRKGGKVNPVSGIVSRMN